MFENGSSEFVITEIRTRVLCGVGRVRTGRKRNPMDGGTLGVYRFFGNFEGEYRGVVIDIAADAAGLVHLSYPFKGAD